MALTTAQQQACVREVVAATEPSPVNWSHADLLACIVAADTWAANNAAAFNTALPAGNFKSNASVALKNALLMAVCKRRFGQ